MIIFYVDDSGDERLTTFSAIGVPVDRWTAGLDCWLGWRRRLRAVHGVDVDYRLHATHWVAGRGRAATNPRSDLDRSKPSRWREYVAALQALRAAPGLSLLTVAKEGVDRANTYRRLMRQINAWLREADEHALVIIDGDNDELRTLHGELALDARRTVEDPWKRDARESQWLQAADFVAFAAYQHVARRPERAFMWHWYEQCLGDRIVRSRDA
jgi:Protein of unknown function (DUF3800)